MIIHHHPSNETLFRYQSGLLNSGLSLVVSVHLAACAECNNYMAKLSAVAKTLIQDLPQTPLAADVLAQTLALIDNEPQQRAPQKTKARPSPKLALPDGLQLPSPLQKCSIGPLRFIWPGVRLSRVKNPARPEAKIVLLSVNPGRKLPAHGHVGLEFNQILSGSCSDEQGTYYAGDFIEADADTEHQPVVGQCEPCICIISMVGAAKLHGPLGRLLHPFIG